MVDERNSSRAHGQPRDSGRGYGGPGGGGGPRGGRHEPDQDGRGVPLSELDPALTEVSRKLIGCAIEVHKALGPGYERAIYQKALEIELEATGVTYRVDHTYAVTYRGKKVGERRADMVVADRFVVELLASRGEISSAERASVRALLRAADMELGLIINFAERRLKDGLVRVLNPDKLNLPQHDEEHAPGAIEGQG